MTATGTPIVEAVQSTNSGSGELQPEILEYPSLPYDEFNTNLPLALDFHFPSNDVPNWSEFLQMLDLPGDLVQQ